MRMDLPLHFIRLSSSLKTVMPVLVNKDVVPLSELLPMLIKDVGKRLPCLS
jgi:hypothetical protein